MYPQALGTVFGYAVTLYLLFQVAAVFVAAPAAVWSGRARGFSSRVSLAALLAGIVGAFFGGRVVDNVTVSRWLGPLRQIRPCCSLTNRSRLSIQNSASMSVRRCWI